MISASEAKKFREKCIADRFTTFENNNKSFLIEIDESIRTACEYDCSEIEIYYKCECLSISKIRDITWHPMYTRIREEDLFNIFIKYMTSKGYTVNKDCESVIIKW